MNDDWLDSLGLVSGEGAFYEDWRQEDLTDALGQVQCPHAHDELDQCRSKCSVCDGGYGPSCPECRAVV